MQTANAIEESLIQFLFNYYSIIAMNLQHNLIIYAVNINSNPRKDHF